MIDKWELLDLLATKFKLFMYDNFLSTDQINSAVTGTASVSNKAFKLQLNTGSLAKSKAKIYYNNNLFNPIYSTAMFRARLNSISDLRAFFGFKESSADVNWGGTPEIAESSSGFMIDDGKIYAYTSRLTDEGPPPAYSEQKTELTGLRLTSNLYPDVTRDFIFKIVNYNFYTFPLPQVIPYFDGFRITTPDRIWTLGTGNTTYPPEDKAHYLFACIENMTGVDKYLKFSHVTYAEEYAD